MRGALTAEGHGAQSPGMTVSGRRPASGRPVRGGHRPGTRRTAAPPAGTGAAASLLRRAPRAERSRKHPSTRAPREQAHTSSTPATEHPEIVTSTPRTEPRPEQPGTRAPREQAHTPHTPAAEPHPEASPAPGADPDGSRRSTRRTPAGPLPAEVRERHRLPGRLGGMAPAHDGPAPEAARHEGHRAGQGRPPATGPPTPCDRPTQPTGRGGEVHTRASGQRSVVRTTQRRQSHSAPSGWRS